MLIHQIHNSLNSQIFNVALYNSLDVSRHLHRGYEFICVMEGSLEVSIHESTYRLNRDSCILISPYQIHSFRSKDFCYYFVIVFSDYEVGSFAQIIRKKTTENPVFTPPPAALAYIKSILLPPDRKPPTKFCFLPRPDLLSTKAALYAICAEFMKQCTFSEVSQREQTWIMEALSYIEEHFTSDISLHDMAKTLGYNYEYLSREFNRTLGVNFKNLVNQYRCERARHLIENSGTSLTDIAHQSGFQSIRSFNRVFKEQMGVLPSELRRTHETKPRNSAKGEKHVTNEKAFQ